MLLLSTNCLFHLLISVLLETNRSKELYVKLSTTNEVIFSSQLFGGIVTSSAMWAIADDDPTNRFRGKRLIFSLEKAHGYRDIWATALDQQVLADSLNEMQ